jgi:hypothetical protein
VTALRAAEKGYRVGVMESGRRWSDSAIPKSKWDITSKSMGGSKCEMLQTFCQLPGG